MRLFSSYRATRELRWIRLGFLDGHIMGPGRCVEDLVPQRLMTQGREAEATAQQPHYSTVWGVVLLG